MIKGHTEIQLYKDGKMVQNTHDDNMLTNALANYFKNYGQINPNAFGEDIRNDLITTLLGGVLLLDTALPEQASLTHVPGGVLMVGNGAYGVSNGSTPGDPTEMGSFNASQSGWADNNKTQFRMVWDFTTEQSNGTIACACLTSRAHGFVGEGNATSKAYRTNGSYTPRTYGQIISVPSNGHKIYIDANDYVYTTSNISTDTRELKIYRQKRSLRSVDVRSTYDATDSGDPWKVFTIDPSITLQNSDEPYFCGSDSTYIYMAVIHSQQLQLLIIPKTFNSIGVRIIPRADLGIGGEVGHNTWMVDGDYIYAFATDYHEPKDGRKIDINTLQGVDINADVRVVNAWDRTDDGGKIRFQQCIYDKTLNRLLKTNCGDIGQGNFRGANFDHPYRESLFIDEDNNDSWYAPGSRRRNDYIATINNLSTPVTKDNTQTMKVIYTLTFTG